MKRALPVVVLLVVAIGVWLAMRAPSSEPSRSRVGEASSAAPDDPAESTARAIATAPVDARDAGFAAPDHTVRDRATRDLVRAQIYRAWTEAMGAPPPAQVDPTHAPMPTLDGGRVDPNYLRQRIREDFLPMAASCYEQYQRRVPGQEGRVVMRFVILGDVHAGGVVDEAELEGTDGGLGDGGTGDPEFATCLRESMMAMAFQPPPESGRLRVTYPFAFRASDAGTPSP